MTKEEWITAQLAKMPDYGPEFRADLLKRWNLKPED